MIKKYLLVAVLIFTLVIPVMTWAESDNNNDDLEEDNEQTEINDDSDNDDDDNDDDTVAQLKKRIAELLAIIAKLRGETSDPVRSGDECRLDVDFPRDLFFGDQDFGSSKSIEALQKALEKRGLLNMPSGAAYGFFGNLTMTALKRFQNQNGISEVRGDYAYVGLQTRRALSGCDSKVSFPIPFEPIKQKGNLPPVIHGVSGPTSLKVGERGTWTVKASDPEGGLLRYLVSWPNEFGEATFTEVPGQTAKFTNIFTRAGTYIINFSVKDNADNQQLTSLSVVVGGGSSREPNINVLSPSNGASYALNQQLPISWTVDANTSLPANGFFYINIFDPSQGKETNIGSTPINTKSLNWPINGSITPPGKYKLRIYCSYTAGFTQVPCWNNNFSGFSGTFTITSGGENGNLTDLTVSGPAYLTATPISVQAGGRVTLSPWQIKNQSNVALPAGNFSNGFYLSTDSLITSGDRQLDGNWNDDLVLPPGGVFYWGGPTLTIPSDITAGTYYIGILVDDKNMVAESNEQNNYKATRIVIGNSGNSNYPNIRVTYPNGGERIDRGSTITVRWTGGPTDGKVNIFVNDMLSGYTSKSSVLRENTANDGQETVELPTSVTPGYYKIRVACSSCPSANSVMFDDSDSTFIIQNSPTNDPTTTHLKVISPNGGETLRLGSSQEISWSGGQADWKINLFIFDADPAKAVTNQRNIIFNSPNDAQESIQIPEDLTPGSYKMRVACENCSTFPTGWYDDSDASFKVE